MSDTDVKHPLVKPEGGCAIAAALVKAHLNLRAIGKDATNPHFKNKYASLDAILETVRPILAEQGLVVTQTSETLMDGKALKVISILLHESGEWLSSEAFVPLSKQDAQGAGGALTYGRRYSLCALLALATDEDDDGNTASRPAQRQQRAPKPEPAPENFHGSNSTKPDADKAWPFGEKKGTRLGDFSTEELKQMQKWCKEKKKDDIAKAIGNVLTDRALSPENAEARMQRVHAAVAAEDKELPF